MGPSIKYVTLFWTNFYPPVTLCHTSRTPRLLVVHSYIHMSLFTEGFVLVRRGFVLGVLSGVFCLEGFVRGDFCRSPFCNNIYICYNRKLNITFNFRFHMYEFFLKCDVTCSWTLPLSHTVTPSRTPSPSSVTYFMDGLYMNPPWMAGKISHY